MSSPWEVAAASDVGRVREHNEDAFFVDAGRGVFLVADGMGGHAAGEVASAIAAEAIGAMLAGASEEFERLPEVMRHAFTEAWKGIVHHGEANPETRGMGTTVTALVLSPSGRWHLVHIGDSRAYHLEEGVLRQITVDHTWVQGEVEAGRVSPEAARTHPLSHVLTRVLSATSPPAPDLYAGTLHPGDRLLLATDGLNAVLPDREIEEILRRPAPLADCARALVEAANERGGPDNVTVVLIRRR